MSAFIFGNYVEKQIIHRAELAAGIKSKAALLEALSIALRFPDYFGMNWDALNECICDLSWLPPGDVILSHQDLPLSEDRSSLSIYLLILKDAVEVWNTRGSNLIFASPGKRDATGQRALLIKRKLLVTFPPDTQTVVESILSSASTL
ncbi:MAG TPA: barstar family protein [Pseudomonadales bacterium]|nr:barstar family protein [Pseudomonadales bacterium]